MSQLQFTFDSTRTFTNQKCFIIATFDLYLLGLLNSQTVWRVIKQHSPELRGGYTEPRKELITSLSIPIACDVDRLAISNLVQHCLDAKGVGCESWEQEIDQRIEGLYGL